jgi:hypothetical protein
MFDRGLWRAGLCRVAVFEPDAVEDAASTCYWGRLADRPIGLFIIFTLGGPISHYEGRTIGQTALSQTKQPISYIHYIVHILHRPFHYRTVEESIDSFQVKGTIGCQSLLQYRRWGYKQGVK